MSRASTILLILFSFAFFVALISAATNSQFLPQMEMTVIWLRQSMGSLLALAAALAILVRALNGKPLKDLITLVVALFAALAIVTTSWTLTFPLGAIVVLLVIRGFILPLIAKNDSA